MASIATAVGRRYSIAKHGLQKRLEFKVMQMYSRVEFHDCPLRHWKVSKSCQKHIVGFMIYRGTMGYKYA